MAKTSAVRRTETSKWISVPRSRRVISNRIPALTLAVLALSCSASKRSAPPPDVMLRVAEAMRSPESNRAVLENPKVFVAVALRSRAEPDNTELKSMSRELARIQLRAISARRESLRTQRAHLYELAKRAKLESANDLITIAYNVDIDATARLAQRFLEKSESLYLAGLSVLGLGTPSALQAIQTPETSSGLEPNAPPDTLSAILQALQSRGYEVDWNHAEGVAISVGATLGGADGALASTQTAAPRGVNAAAALESLYGAFGEALSRSLAPEAAPSAHLVTRAVFERIAHRATTWISDLGLPEAAANQQARRSRLWDLVRRREQAARLRFERTWLARPGVRADEVYQNEIVERLHVTSDFEAFSSQPPEWGQAVARFRAAHRSYRLENYLAKTHGERWWEQPALLDTLKDYAMGRIAHAENDGTAPSLVPVARTLIGD